MRCALTAATLAICVATPPSTSHAESLYLCRAYSGGTFWSQAHCNQHNALIERIVSVPESLQFDQQVALGEQQRSAMAAQAARQNSTVTTTTTTQRHIQPDRSAECSALAASIQHYDAMARQPQSGQMQDWITAQRKKARDRQFQIKC